MSEFKFPTEQVELPSKGLVYPPDSPLRSGKVEMKYMTAKEEDILSNQNLIEKGIVLEKLLDSLLQGKVDTSSLVTGDKNAIFIAARVLGYGKEYKFSYNDKEVTIDLSTVEPKPFDESIVDDNGFIEFTLPKSEVKVKFKILTDKEEDKLNKDIKSLSKFNNGGGEVTTRLKHQIVSINDDDNKSEIKNFIDNYMLAQDSRALRNYIKEISPDIDMSHTLEDGKEIQIPIGIGFFWPDL
ncbi:MAG: hypothetical protein GY830_00215 [Bacteroidetes bacterium]|nr:hypothetical protein [Bacteroidota bacterium]